VDYKDLFKKVENAIAVYTSELDRSSAGDPEVLGRQRWTYKEILLLISG
jgi:type I restriction enzyme, R subunit